MLIDEYFHQIEDDIAHCLAIIKTDLLKDKRSLYIGFIEGTVSFLDGSELHFVEFVNVKTGVNRYKYSYHYQNASEQRIFRYDMAPHHQAIMTFPHHKHTSSWQVIEAFAPDLKHVLEEIEQLLP